MAKNIYTYGGQPARRNLTVACLQANKAAGVKMTQVSALNGDEAAACAAMGIDLITIADVDIVAVRAAAPETFITGSQTMVQYMTEDEALAAAIRCAEAGADAIYTPRGLKTIERLAGEGLAVQGHLGLVPRKSTLIGGLRTVGKTADEALRLFQDFKRLEDAGAVAAEVDANVVMTGSGEVIEVQMTGEERPFQRAELEAMLTLAEAGVRDLVAAQRRALGLDPGRDEGS